MFYESCRSNQPIKGEVHWELSKCLLKKRPELESVSYKDANSHHLGHHIPIFGWSHAIHHWQLTWLVCFPLFPPSVNNAAIRPIFFMPTGAVAKKTSAHLISSRSPTSFASDVSSPTVYRDPPTKVIIILVMTGTGMGSIARHHCCCSSRDGFQNPALSSLGAS